MVLQTERYNGGYQQQNYSAYQGPNDCYSSFQDVTEYTTPYYGNPRIPTYPSSHAPHPQSGWSTGGDYYGNGAGHYAGGGMITPMKPTTDGYGTSHYENSYTYGSQSNHGSLHHQGHGNPHGHQGHGTPHGQSHGSPPHHQGHGTPHGQGHGSPPHHQGYGSPYDQGHGGKTHGYGNSHGYGGGIKTQINKLTHGHNTYGSNNPNYGHSPSGMNQGYNQKPSWILKGLDDDDE